MSEFKGTKGKWSIKDKTSGFETDVHVGNIRICEVKHYPNEIGEWEKDPTKEEGKANAKLIACAPELLQMVKDLLMNRNHMNEDQIWLAKELIKKATL
jgi:hypothetical protein